MSARLHYVTGKGGVGKSTIAAAIALRAASRGARVLAIELSEPAGLCRILDTRPPSPGAITRAVGGTHVAYFDGASAMAEYLTRRMHLGPLVRAIIDHPLYTAFVDAAPGLRELMAIGKVRDETVLQHRWDVVVVDAGASGHALGYLRMPATAAGAFRSGRVHREAERNAALLRDRSTTAIHIVATAEEMPLREAAATRSTLNELGVALGRVIVNRCMPAAPGDVDAILDRLVAPALTTTLRAVRRWEQIQQQNISQFEEFLGAPVVRTPRVRDAAGFTQASTIAAALSEVIP